MYTWKFYLGLILICIFVQGFFTMVELACVSFNKVRLQYYISRGNRRAKWLSYLLNHPGQLFGSALIGINFALLVASEAGRNFFVSLGQSPDLAPLLLFVPILIFAEIAPLFAGRRYAEHAVMLGVPILYALSILLRPIIWFLDLLCTGINRLMKSPRSAGLYLTRDELQRVLEEQEVRPFTATSAEFETIVGRIFSMKNKRAKELMKPLDKVTMLPIHCTIAEMRKQLATDYSPFLPLYHRSAQNIIAIAYPRDLLRFEDGVRIREHARAPWFITEGTSILQILKQFRRNNRSIAVVLNETGLAVGILSLDEIVDELFGQVDTWESFDEILPRTHHVVVDRTFDGDMKIQEFNAQFHVHLPEDGVETLGELVAKELGHPPVEGESVRLDQFELTVEEASLLGVKTISVRTVY